MDIKEKIAPIQESLLEFRHAIHQDAEMSMKEFNTTKRIIDMLKNVPNLELTDLNPGVLAVLKGGKAGKTVALRADMDALPLTEESGLPFASKNEGVCHACGHDIHTTALLGAVMILAPMAASLSGTIKFLFQPGEEILAGAKHLIAKGVLENPKVDAVFGLHCSSVDRVGSVILKHGPLMASADFIDITVTGRQGHAAYPHKSIDSVVVASHIVVALQNIVSREVDPLDSAVVTLGSIHGGTVGNIIAPNVKLAGTVRTLNPDVRNKIEERISKIVKLTAEAHNATAEVVYTRGTPAVINNKDLMPCLETAAEQTVGADKVVYLERPMMGGEDFAFYQEVVPGAFFRIGTANDDEQTQVPLHNSRIRFDEKALPIGVEMLCRSALSFLEN